MQHSIDVSTPGKIKPCDMRDYDFAVRTNFCNTFVIASVYPIAGEVCTLGSPMYDIACSSSSGTELHLGLRIPGLDHAQHATLQSELEDMRSELGRLRTGLRAYDEASMLLAAATAAGSGKKMNISSLHVVPSILNNLPDIQTVAKLQQGLQQVYCVHGVETASAVLSAPNSISYMPGATCLQMHMVSLNIADMSPINRARVSPIPRKKIAVQV